MKWKKKIPGEGWTPPPPCFASNNFCLANDGVYYTIPTDSNQPLVGAGHLYVRWTDEQSLLTSERGKPGFPGLARDGTTSYDFRVSVRALANGNVQMTQMARNAVDDRRGTDLP